MMKKHSWWLETHRYAPELNKIYIRGVKINIPGTTSIQEYRKNRKLKRNQYTLRVHLEFNSKEHPHLDRSYRGLVDNYQELKNFIEDRKKYHCFSTMSIKFIQKVWV